jgi:transforming growth factor-beta-induced protein
MEEEEMMEEEPADIVDIAVADGRFNTLVAAVEAAGLADALSGEGPLTVFAPTDDAFAALPEGTVDALLQDIPSLQSILLYHVVEGAVPAADVVGLDKAQTLNGQFVDIKVDGDSVMIDDANVIITDIEAANGIIHVIDAVILPESRSIAEIAVEDGSFETLVAALDAAGLVETLSGEGEFTVFAPTDDAFAALPEGTVEALLGDIPALTEILLFHVADGKLMASDVLGRSIIPTLQGQYLDVDAENAAINGAGIIVTDIEASNGVIHVIDAVVLPESRSIAEIAVEDGRFETLVAALDAAGLVETLSGEGSFTVFAPTDDAFAALPDGTVEGLLADVDALTNVLLYHVVDGKVMSVDVVALTQAEALQGDSLDVSFDGESVKINESTVIIPDIEASNGVIHVIDAVLLPPAE